MFINSPSSSNWWMRSCYLSVLPAAPPRTYLLSPGFTTTPTHSHVSLHNSAGCTQLKTPLSVSLSLSHTETPSSLLLHGWALHVLHWGQRGHSAGCRSRPDALNSQDTNDSHCCNEEKQHRRVFPGTTGLLIWTMGLNEELPEIKKMCQRLKKA